jgi:hypothetical protein
VLKPVALSGSRGVIRADDAAEARRAFARIAALLRSPQVRTLREEACDFIQAERYIEGVEVAVEALVVKGRLTPLAIFDKPDPLVGPYFEETIYVTPSRLSDGAQQAIIATVEQSVRALGLFHGPVHAEFRLRDEGRDSRVWVLEIAARSIGGLCSRALRFSSADSNEHISLEELIVRNALQQDVSRAGREEQASGVMMIPIPAAGFYHDVEGVDDALRTAGVEDIRITAKAGQELIPLPEGASYLGFIFARCETPAEVEQALRSAHAQLRFVVTPKLPVLAR